MPQSGEHHPHYPGDKDPSEDEIRGAGIFGFCLFCLYGNISKTDGKAEIYFPLSAEGWCTGPYLLVGPVINLPVGDLNPVFLIGRVVEGTAFMFLMNFMSNVRFLRCKNDQGMAL